MLNFKTKISLFILTLFFCISSFAATQVIATPYFRIALDPAMKSYENSSKNIQGHLTYVYGYSAHYKHVDAYLGIIVATSLPQNERDNPDRAQRQFIAGTINGLHRKNNLPKPDIYTIYDDVKSIRVNGREFKKYLVLDEKNGSLIMYTTIHNQTLYGFYITVMSGTTTHADEIRTVSQSLVNAVMQTQFLSP